MYENTERSLGESDIAITVRPSTQPYTLNMLSSDYICTICRRNNLIQDTKEFRIVYCPGCPHSCHKEDPRQMGEIWYQSKIEWRSTSGFVYISMMTVRPNLKSYGHHAPKSCDQRIHGERRIDPANTVVESDFPWRVPLASRKATRNLSRMRLW
jgi:hypothetical protein